MSTTTTILAASTPSISPISQWKMSASTPSLPTSSSSPLPPPIPSSSSSSGHTKTNSPLPSLISLYPRAARAFLQREITLTHSLLTTAFEILYSPSSANIDELDTQRRKWDILRISFQSTLFADPPPNMQQSSLPPTLKEVLSQTPASLIADLHYSSLRLFTPTSLQKPNSAFVPGQILVSLLLAALKVECPDAAKAIAEDWFAQRDVMLGPESPQFHQDSDGYEKVVDVYVLHVLSRLEEWDLGFEFIRNEDELSENFREYIRTSFQTSYNRFNEIRSKRTARNAATASSHLFSSPNNRHTASIISASRSVSPSLSTSSTSSSSSLDTTSTHTIVPNRRPSFVNLAGVAALTPTILSSSLSPPANGNGRAKRPSTNASDSLDSSSKGAAYQANGHPKSVPPALVRALSDPKIAGPSGGASRDNVPNGNHHLKTTSKSSGVWTNIYHHFASKIRNIFSAQTRYILTALFVVVPLITFLLRIRRARRALRNGSSASRAVGSGSDIRRRLQAQRDGMGSGMLWGFWMEVVTAVLDAIRMAGGGLV